MPTLPTPQDRFQALDLCELKWTPSLEYSVESVEQSDLAILLEISKTGGLFQTSVYVPPNVIVQIRIGDAAIEGSVFSSSQDEFGFLSEIRVSSSSDWFPQQYQPAYLIFPTPLAA